MESRNHFQPSKVKPVMVQHHLDLQRARLNAEQAGWNGWTLAGHLPIGIAKRPDAVTSTPLGDSIAVELERTVKTRKRYESIFANYLQAIKAGDYHCVHYVCPDAGFAARLKRLFATITAVPVAGQRVAINEKHRARFPVFALDDWPPRAG